MNIIQFIDGGYEIFDHGFVVTHYIWETIFDEESPYQIYSKNQCQMMVDFCNENKINFEDYYEH